MGGEGGGWEEVVEHVVARLAEGVPDDQLLDLLEDATAAFVSTDLIHRLVPHAPRLLSLTYDAHPGAGLTAGVAICAIDRPSGRRLLTTSREAFACAGDDVGHGYGCFLEGLEDLGEGNLDGASAWWQRSRDLLGREHAIDGFTMAHLALGAYQGGDLARALTLAEAALAAAEQRRDDRLEMISALYVGFFRLWTGDFSRVEQAVSHGLAASDRIAEPLNRYDTPLLWATRGALASLRGQFDEADAAFEAGLDLAALLHNEWHEAIVRSVRAEFLSAQDPIRAITDAQRALTYFEHVGEAWWSSWARQSMAATHLHLGDLGAAEYHCDVLFAGAQSTLERGRALLVLGEIEARTDRSVEARQHLSDAIKSLECAGAAFWAAQAELLLATVDSRRASYLCRSAEGRAGRNRNDVAWKRMLRGAGTLEVRVLGGLEVHVNGALVAFKTRAEAEVVAMLVEAAPGARSAELIADRLWPTANGEQSAHRLDNLLSNLRRSLLPTTRLRRDRGALRLELEPDECDLLRARLDATGDAADRAAAAERLRQPFLGDSPPEWAYEVQDDLFRLRSDLLAGDL